MPQYITIKETDKLFSDFKVGDKVFCLTIKELACCGISEQTVLSGIKRQRQGLVYCWGYHKTGKIIYVHYESLKDNYKALIKVVLLESLPPVEWWNLRSRDIIIRNRLLNNLSLTSPDENEIMNVILPTGEQLPENERGKLRVASIWINFLIKHETKASINALGYEKAAQFYDDVIYYFKKENIKLPYNYQKLKEKMKNYKENGIETLVDKRLCTNLNAAKIKTPEQHAVLVRLMAHHNNLDATRIVAPYNAVAKLKGWETVSARTISRYLEKNKLILTAARQGKKAFRDNISMQVKRSRPTFPLAFWSLDGWKAELYYQKESKNNKGQRIIKYDNRLVIYIVLDVFNNYPVGYAIGETENTQLAIKALKNAADHCAELFGGYFRPYQIQSDRAGIKTLKPVFSGFAKHFTPAAVGNAKAKPVESYNRYLIDNYCVYFDNFAGFGIKSKRQPNIDIKNLIKKNFPTKEECISQLSFIIGKERENKKGAFIQSWQNLAEEKRLPLSRENYLNLFGETTARPIRFNGHGICPTINGETTAYDTFDITFRRDLLTAYTIYYDNNDLTTVLAVSPDEKRRYLLDAKHIQPTALVERTENDAKELKKIFEFNRNLENAVSETLGTAYEISNAVIEPLIEHLDDEKSAAVLLTDNRGQHKENIYFKNYEPDAAKQKAIPLKKSPKKEPKQPKNAPNSNYLEWVQNQFEENFK